LGVKPDHSSNCPDMEGHLDLELDVKISGNDKIICLYLFAYIFKTENKNIGNILMPL
jgi:hypothetical protein